MFFTQCKRKKSIKKSQSLYSFVLEKAMSSSSNSGGLSLVKQIEKLQKESIEKEQKLIEKEKEMLVLKKENNRLQNEINLNSISNNKKRKSYPRYGEPALKKKKIHSSIPKFTSNESPVNENESNDSRSVDIFDSTSQIEIPQESGIPFKESSEQSPQYLSESDTSTVSDNASDSSDTNYSPGTNESEESEQYTFCKCEHVLTSNCNKTSTNTVAIIKHVKQSTLSKMQKKH